MIKAFAIATISLPLSGRIGIAPLPGKSDDLAGDISAICSWNAKHVVSTTQTSELLRYNAGSIGTELKAHGVIWWHLPIVDFGIPDAAEIRHWAQLSVKLHAALDAGENVLLHCMGGKGRSGMIALRLLIERGEDPVDALARIRAARPGAVETDAQLAWAVAGQSRVQAKPTTDLAR